MIDTNEALSSIGISAQNLTQAQKAIARTIIVLRDGSNAFGDMAKTIDTLQNRIRVLQGSWENLQLVLGSALEGVVSTGISYLIGIIQAITAIVQSFTGGIKEIEEESANASDGLNESLEETQETANNLSFDKFETLTTGENENLTTTQALNDLLNQQITQYEQISQLYSGIDAKVQSVKDGILDFIFPDRIEDSLGNVNTILIAISTVIGTIMGLGIFGKLSTLLSGNGLLTKLVGVLTSIRTAGLAPTVEVLKKTGTSLGGLTKILDVISTHPIIAIITLVISLLTALYFGNEDFRKSVNKLFETLSPLLTIVGDLLSMLIDIVVVALQPIANILGGVLKYVIEMINVSLAGTMLVLVPILYVFEAILKVLSTIVEVINALFKFDFSNLGNKLGNIWSNWGSTDFAKSSWGNFTGAFGFANGGIPNKSELFYMNENGVPEALINTGGSQTNVVNMQQLRQMTKEGFVEAIRETGLGNGFTMTIEGRNIDNSSIARGIFPALKVESKRQGGNQL